MEEVSEVGGLSHKGNVKELVSGWAGIQIQESSRVCSRSLPCCIFNLYSPWLSFLYKIKQQGHGTLSLWGTRGTCVLCGGCPGEPCCLAPGPNEVFELWRAPGSPWAQRLTEYVSVVSWNCIPMFPEDAVAAVWEPYFEIPFLGSWGRLGRLPFPTSCTDGS